ncbi:MAG: PorT family protein [Bacteroidales bacterium]|nr:PorT family protein [Bacteroidales bacterium]HPD94653.1 porin family protein [Tenuifilaceae bacterium]HRX31058.1 porin family protein [Tenuifilaceae bacterium]
MKRLLFVISTLIFSLSNVGELKAQKYSFGVFVDPQLSWFNSDTKRFDPNGPVTGFNIGFSGEKFFASRYSLASGISINNLGGKIRVLQDGLTLKTRDGDYAIDSNSTVTYKAQYFSIPLGFKFRTNQIGYSTFFAQVGLQGNIRLKSYAWYNPADVSKETCTQPFMWGFASYFLGIGMEYSLGGESAVQVGLSYTDGLTKMLDLPNAVITSQSLTLRVGITF